MPTYAYDRAKGTPLTEDQKAALSAQLDKLGGPSPLSAEEKDQILSLPLEYWNDPQTAKFISGVVSSMINTPPFDPINQPDSANPRDSAVNMLNQITGGAYGPMTGKPWSDLFQPVQNVGAANAGMVALGGAGAALGAAGVGGGLGLSDVGSVGAGEIGGGGASGVPFGTTLGGEAGGSAAAPYYSGADAGAISSGINPETGLPMNLGQEQLGVAGTDVGANAGDAALPGITGGTGAAGSSPALLAGPGATTTAGAAAGGTALSRVTDGTGSTADILSVLGGAGATGLGVYGSIEQQKSLNDLANKLYETGAPSRARFEASMTPGFDPTSIPGYSGAVDTASESILRKLSATQGNPYGSPGGLIEANKAIISGTALPAVQAYQNQNAAAGGFQGFSNAFPSTATGAVGAQGNVYNAVGSGLANLTNPPPDYTQFLKYLNRGIP